MEAENMKLHNGICSVEISVDTTYTVNSADNKPYDLVLNPCGFKQRDIYKALSIRIDLFYKTISIVLIGSFYSYVEDCAVLENEVLTILQGEAIVRIDVNTGALLEFKELGDLDINFAIYKVTCGYVIYGEQKISMLDKDLNRQWSFWGRDIFVSISGKKPFELCENSIKLYDFSDNFYEIDFTGKQIG